MGSAMLHRERCRSVEFSDGACRNRRPVAAAAAAAGCTVGLVPPAVQGGLEPGRKQLQHGIQVRPQHSACMHSIWLLLTAAAAAGTPQRYARTVHSLLVPGVQQLSGSALSRDYIPCACRLTKSTHWHITLKAH
jgi:hypothetical protein